MQQKGAYVYKQRSERAIKYLSVKQQASVARAEKISCTVVLHGPKDEEISD